MDVKVSALREWRKGARNQRMLDGTLRIQLTLNRGQLFAVADSDSISTERRTGNKSSCVEASTMGRVKQNQFRGPFADFVLPLIDGQVRVRVVERDGGVGRQVFEQAQMPLRVRVLPETLDAEHAQNAFLRDKRQIDHRSRRLRNTAVFEHSARVRIRRDVL